MKYITSKKTFPVAILDLPLVRKALDGRRGAMYVYGDGDHVFRVRAREFDYPDIMRELKVAIELHEKKINKENKSTTLHAHTKSVDNSKIKSPKEVNSMGFFSKKNKTTEPGRLSETPPAKVEERIEGSQSASIQASVSDSGGKTSVSSPEGSMAKGIEARYTAYGKIISVFEKDPRFADLPLRQISGLISAAIVAGQYVIVQPHRQGSDLIGSPIAVVLWANVSEEVDRKLTESLNIPTTLTPNDWNSGDIPWLMLSSGSEKAIALVLRGLSDKLPAGKSFKAIITDNHGVTRISTLTVTERASET